MNESSEREAQPRIRVKYDDLTAKYANQAVVNGSLEEIYFDFTSGGILDPSSGEWILAVHTRIAMHPAAARRFIQTVGQALDRLAQESASEAAASFPRLEA